MMERAIGLGVGKPHIRKCSGQFPGAVWRTASFWTCESRGKSSFGRFFNGFGMTPKEAYDDWKRWSVRAAAQSDAMSRSN